MELVETSGVWPQGLLDPFVAMIPKADGDSTPLGQRLLSVLPVVYRLWASLRLGHLRGFSTALDMEEVLSGTGGDQLHVMVANVIKSSDTVDRSILYCALDRLGLIDSFRRAFFFHGQGSA